MRIHGTWRSNIVPNNSKFQKYNSHIACQKRSRFGVICMRLESEIIDETGPLHLNLSELMLHAK